MNPADPAKPDSPANAVEIFRTRRSRRRFLDGPLDPAQVEALKNVALWSPTAMNKRDTKFLFVSRREALADLASRLSNARFLGSAALGVAVMGCCEGYAPVEDSSIAAVNLQLAAHALGLGSCWAHVPHMTGRDGRSAAANVADVLDVPEGYFVECIVGIGRPDPSEPGMPCGERPQDQSRVSELR